MAHFVISIAHIRVLNQQFSASGDLLAKLIRIAPCVVLLLEYLSLNLRVALLVNLSLYSRLVVNIFRHGAEQSLIRSERVLPEAVAQSHFQPRHAVQPEVEALRFEHYGR